MSDDTWSCNFLTAFETKNGAVYPVTHGVGTDISRMIMSAFYAIPYLETLFRHCYFWTYNIWTLMSLAMTPEVDIYVLTDDLCIGYRYLFSDALCYRHRHVFFLRFSLLWSWRVLLI